MSLLDLGCLIRRVLTPAREKLEVLISFLQNICSHPLLLERWWGYVSKNISLIDNDNNYLYLSFCTASCVYFCVGEPYRSVSAPQGLPSLVSSPNQTICHWTLWTLDTGHWTMGIKHHWTMTLTPRKTPYKDCYGHYAMSPKLGLVSQPDHLSLDTLDTGH